jgi:hypothetical protein
MQAENECNEIFVSVLLSFVSRMLNSQVRNEPIYAASY